MNFRSVFITDAERQFAPPADETTAAHLQTLTAIAARKSPSPQALAARKRAAQRNREAADLRQDRLDLLTVAGDPIGMKLAVLL